MEDSADSFSEPAALPLRKFHDYELLEEIARGGMGVVYRARQISLNRTVAVKMILTGQLASDTEVQRFRAEAEAAAHLQHPNIVRIHEFGEFEGQHYFSMDYIEGQSLTETTAGRAAENPEWFRRAAGWVKTIAEAIHYAHEHGVLHRDLKPSNVLIDNSGQPHITDFGLAKRLTSAGPGAPGAELTLPGQVLGTPNFMPPEQAAGKRDVLGPQSDVYSLGAILYFLLTGRPPFQGDTTHETITNLLNNAPASPRSFNRTVPRDLETICLKCLEKKSPRRYGSARELADDLGRFLCDETIRARPVGRPEKLWRLCRRHPAASGLAFIGAILLLAPATYWLFAKPVIPSMPVFSGEGASGVIDKELYIATGLDGTDGAHGHLHVYVPAKNRWRELDAPPIPHIGGAFGVLNGKFYLAGGADAEGIETGRLDMFNPSSSTWTTEQAMPTARMYCAGAVLDDQLYVLGGQSGSNVLATVEAYDPARDVWTTAVSLPTQRSQLGAAVLRGVLYAVGGRARSEGTDAVGEVWGFEREQRQWISRPSLREPRARAFFTAFNDILYVAGGFHSGETQTFQAWSP